MKMLSAKLEQKDTPQRARELKRLKGLIKAAEIAAVQAERRDRNARVTINRLPAELLREIFVTTCTVKLAEYRWTRYQCNSINIVWNPTWVQKDRAVHLMLVCCHWKEVALGIRELWNTIETHWHHKDQVLLERSGRGPLKVLARRKLEPSSAVAHALQNVEHSSRIQELYWIWSSAREDLRMPVPSLRSLALQGDFTVRVPGGSFKLFNNHTPCLERLSLSNVHWLPSNTFAKLTFLALDYCIVPKAPINLRSLLSGAPNLIDLILRSVADRNNMNRQEQIEAADTKPVSLPRLRRLLIDYMWADDIDYVFRDAQLNEDVSVSIKCGKKRDNNQRLLELVSTWSLNALKQPKELHFQPNVAIVTGASSGLRFELEESMTLEDWTTLDWPRILPLSSISHLCTFERAACRPSDLECVCNLLRQMTALQTLSVNIEGLTKIVDALTLFREPTDPLVCSALTTFRIAILDDSDCDIILDSVLPLRAQLGVKQLHVGLLDVDGDPSEHWRPHQAVKDQLHGNFESVNFETLLYENAYNITLPPVCDEEAHALWPPWL